MTTKTISTEAWVEVDVDIDEFEDSELIDEIQSRGYKVQSTHQYDNDIAALYNEFSLGNKDKVLEMLPNFFYATIGRIV